MSLQKESNIFVWGKTLFNYVFLPLVIALGIILLASLFYKVETFSSWLKGYQGIIGSIIAVIAAVAAIVAQSNYVQKQINSQRDIESNRQRSESRDKIIAALSESYKLSILVRNYSSQSDGFTELSGSICANTTALQILWRRVYPRNYKYCTSLAKCLLVIYDLKAAQNSSHLKMALIANIESTPIKTTFESLRETLNRCHQGLLLQIDNEGADFSEEIKLCIKAYDGFYKEMISIVDKDVI